MIVGGQRHLIAILEIGHHEGAAAEWPPIKGVITGDLIDRNRREHMRRQDRRGGKGLEERCVRRP